MPFTPQQRREAIRAYRSYRKHRSHLRGHYPPTDDAQQQVLDDYADAIREMAQQLKKPDRWVNVVELTRSDGWARWLAMEYRRLKAIE